MTAQSLPEIDSYIENAPEYAVPILEEIRSIFHEADDRMEEAVKWNAPHFVLEGIVGSMAAFRNHVRLIFWHGQLMEDPENLLSPVGSKTDMGSMDVKTIDDLPSRGTLVQYVREAVTLNVEGVSTRRERSAAAPPELPEDLQQALEGSPEALASYDGFSPSEQREYTEWITEAKREETRTRRVATAVEWMAEGKPRNWKYMDKWRSDIE